MCGGLLAETGDESHLVVVLVQLALIIGVARVFAAAFRKIGQPAVVGEIVAGIMLGPSVFGKLEVLAGFSGHELSHWVFDPHLTPVFEVLGQLGLILLLFVVGLEFELTHLKKNSRSALMISAAGVILPFVFGWGLAHWARPHLNLEVIVDGVTQPLRKHGFALFMGTAMSITALPVLGRMMLEFGITRTRVGTVTLTAAAADDVTGWILLAAVSAMVRADYEIAGTLRMIGLTLAFAAVMIGVARPLLVRWIRWALPREKGELGLNGLTVLLVIMFVVAITTSLIGIFAIFGAFLLGAVLSDQHEFRAAVVRQVRTLVTVLFLPIFFTYTGLRTDVGTLHSGLMWGVAGVVCLVAIGGKVGGCALAARLGGMNWRESACVGVMMNTRGLMELVVVNVGYDLGVIPQSMFCMLVLMALLTTIMTTPLLLWIKRGTELETAMAESEFKRGDMTLAGV